VAKVPVTLDRKWLSYPLYTHRSWDD